MSTSRRNDGWITGPVIFAFEAAGPDPIPIAGLRAFEPDRIQSAELSGFAQDDAHEAEVAAFVALGGWPRLALIATVVATAILLLLGTLAMVPKQADERPTAALPSRGIVWAWGSNDVGQLGQGSYDVVLDTVRVPELAGVVMVSAGTGHSVALREDGTVWTWGSNKAGQLGDGTKVYRSRPGRTSLLEGIAHVASGDFHNVAVGRDGSVWTWGFNGSGQAVGEDQHIRPTPYRVPGLPAAVAAGAGATFSVALTADGEVWAWGGNSQGALGNGRLGGAAYEPVRVPGLPRIVAITTGSHHILAVDEHGDVWAWGSNRGGQLADGTLMDRSVPARIEGLSDVVEVAGGMYYSLARTRDGQVWAWGRHGVRLDDDAAARLASHPTPSLIPVLEGATAIAGGAFEAMVLKDDGTVWGWRVPFPPNGAGFSRLPSFPVQVNGVREAGAVAVGMGHALIVERKADFMAVPPAS
jgi:alpha-tubulin suppressor-like RCC1 family protein